MAAGEADFCRLLEARRKLFWVPRWPRIEYTNKTNRIVTSNSLNMCPHGIGVMSVPVSVSGLCQTVLHEGEYQLYSYDAKTINVEILFNLDEKTYMVHETGYGNTIAILCGVCRSSNHQIFVGNHVLGIPSSISSHHTVPKDEPPSTPYMAA